MNDDDAITLNIIRRTHDTTQLNSEQFAALVQSIWFYLKGGTPHAEAARLAIEDCFPFQQTYGRDHMTGNYYKIKR